MVDMKNLRQKTNVVFFDESAGEYYQAMSMVRGAHGLYPNLKDLRKMAGPDDILEYEIIEEMEYAQSSS